MNRSVTPLSGKVLVVSALAVALLVSGVVVILLVTVAAGLYALERVAQDHPNQRQTIVNVLCAYLRMPFQVPETEPPVGTDPSAHREQVQEREVRLTVLC